MLHSPTSSCSRKGGCVSYIHARYRHAGYWLAREAAVVVAGLGIVYLLKLYDPFAGYLYWLYMIALAFAAGTIRFAPVGPTNVSRDESGRTSFRRGFFS